MIKKKKKGWELDQVHERFSKKQVLCCVGLFSKGRPALSSWLEGGCTFCVYHDDSLHALLALESLQGLLHLCLPARIRPRSERSGSLDQLPCTPSRWITLPNNKHPGTWHHLLQAPRDYLEQPWGQHQHLNHHIPSVGWGCPLCPPGALCPSLSRQQNSNTIARSIGTSMTQLGDKPKETNDFKNSKWRCLTGRRYTVICGPKSTFQRKQNDPMRMDSVTNNLAPGTVWHSTQPEERQRKGLMNPASSGAGLGGATLAHVICKQSGQSDCESSPRQARPSLLLLPSLLPFPPLSTCMSVSPCLHSFLPNKASSSLKYNKFFRIILDITSSMKPLWIPTQWPLAISNGLPELLTVSLWELISAVWLRVSLTVCRAGVQWTVVKLN